MSDTKKIDYIIRVNTTEDNHSLVEKLTKELANALRLKETEIEYFKHWYMEESK